MNSLSPEEIRVATLKALKQLGKEIDKLDDNFDLFRSDVVDSSLSFVKLLLHIEQILGQLFDLAELDFNSLRTLDMLVDQLYSLQTHRVVKNNG